MAGNDFRFSHDRRIGKFGFDHFKKVGEQLEAIVKDGRPNADSKVLTCEDIHTYHWSKISITTDAMLAALKQRKEYKLEEVNREIWKPPYRLDLILSSPESRGSFMIQFTYDKAEPGRLFFYGQDIDDSIHTQIMDRFHKRGFLHRLGDGMHTRDYEAIGEFLGQQQLG